MARSNWGVNGGMAPPHQSPPLCRAVAHGSSLCIDVNASLKDKRGNTHSELQHGADVHLCQIKSPSWQKKNKNKNPQNRKSLVLWSSSQKDFERSLSSYKRQVLSPPPLFYNTGGTEDFPRPLLTSLITSADRGMKGLRSRLSERALQVKSL